MAVVAAVASSNLFHKLFLSLPAGKVDQSFYLFGCLGALPCTWIAGIARCGDVDVLLRSCRVSAGFDAEFGVVLGAAFGRFEPASVLPESDVVEDLDVVDWRGKAFGVVGVVWVRCRV